MHVTRTEQIVKLSGTGSDVEIEPGKQIRVGKSDGYAVKWPGEYEIGGITVRGFASENEAVAYQLTADNVRMYFPASEKFQFAEDDLADLGNLDVVFVAAESSEWSAKDWKKFLEEIEPRMVVFIESGEKTDQLHKEIGGGETVTAKKQEISNKTLPSDKTIFVVLEA